MLSVKSFELHNRAQHVYGEAARVLEFKRVCDEQGEQALAKLGNLMNASHSSCSSQYECSCEELDTLVQLCMLVFSTCVTHEDNRTCETHKTR